jgi:hypothetical protein
MMNDIPKGIEEHVCIVLNKLWGKSFEAKLKKSCFFHQSKVGF